VRHNLGITIPNTASASVTLCNGTNVTMTVGGNVNFVAGGGQNTTKVLLNNAAGDIFQFKVAGNFSSSGFLDGFGGSSSTIEFDGSGAQSLILPTGTNLITATAISYQVDSGSVLTLNSAVSSCGTFTVNSGGRLNFNTNQINGGTALTLNPGAYVGGNGTNQLTSGMNTNHYDGTLDLGSLPSFNNNDSFKLFGATAYGGSFTNLLPATPGVSQTWNTSQLTVNGTLVVFCASCVNSTPTNITSLVSGNALDLSWPADHTGWRLQVQTNSSNGGIRTNWSTVAGSVTTNHVIIPIDLATGSVLYRLIYP
jgi:hypothetical protein